MPHIYVSFKRACGVMDALSGASTYPKNISVWIILRDVKKSFSQSTYQAYKVDRFREILVPFTGGSIKLVLI